MVFFKLFYKYRNGKYSFYEIYYGRGIKVLMNIIRFFLKIILYKFMNSN